jgi:hypothetical protein
LKKQQQSQHQHQHANKHSKHTMRTEGDIIGDTVAPFTSINTADCTGLDAVAAAAVAAVLVPEMLGTTLPCASNVCVRVCMCV